MKYKNYKLKIKFQKQEMKNIKKGINIMNKLIKH